MPLAAGASFIARAVDKDPNHLALILKKAYEHQGCSFIEIYQDCNIFNHGAFDAFALKTNRADKTIVLEEGQPLYFGAKQEWALVLQNEALQCIASTNINDINALYRHDSSNYIAAVRLAQLNFPEFPVPLGIYYQKSRDIYTLDKPSQKSVVDLPALFRLRASWQQGEKTR